MNTPRETKCALTTPQPNTSTTAEFLTGRSDGQWIARGGPGAGAYVRRVYVRRVYVRRPKTIATDRNARMNPLKPNKKPSRSEMRKP